MIQVQGLTKRYRDRVAVDGLSFEVKEGETLGFLGPNGAGKSTTMRMLTGFLPASSGSARVAGFDVFEQPLEVKRSVGYLPEIPPLYLDMTVAAYLRFVAELKAVPRKQLASEVDRVAQLATITHMLDRVVANCSKGYRQRVGIAQALIGDPKVLILDEPTVGLDPQQILEVRGLIKSLQGRHTIILSTHILSEVTASCSRVLVIKHGRLVAYEALSDLTTRFKDGERERSLEEIYLQLTTD